MIISKIKRKADPSLIVSKRIPSYLRKEKIKITNSKKSNINSNSFNKKNVKYNQIPEFIQDIIKYTKFYKQQNEETNKEMNKNKIIYFNNLLNEISKNKNVLTSYLIHELYRCLYELNYLRMDVILNLFNIFLNNTIDFTNLKGYVTCDLKELLNIITYFYHFQYLCKQNIHNILFCKNNINSNNINDYFKLKVVQRYLTEHIHNERSCNSLYNYHTIMYSYIYRYIVKYNKLENIDILLYSLIQNKNKINQKNQLYMDDYTNKLKQVTLQFVNMLKYENNDSFIKNEVNQNTYLLTLNDSMCTFINTPDSEYHNENNQMNQHVDYNKIDGLTTTPIHNDKIDEKTWNEIGEKNKKILIEYINNFYKLNDMFNFLLNKIVLYFNENTDKFYLDNLKLLFFYLCKYKKYNLSILEKIYNKIIERIENLKTNQSFFTTDENMLTENGLHENNMEIAKYDYEQNKIKKVKKKKKHTNSTYIKIDSKEFLLLPYSIGLSMKTYFNNYLIEYVNIYILSLINSRVICDIIHFFYCLIGYQYIMMHFFILYNIFRFKEKCLDNEQLINKYNLFLKKIIEQVNFTEQKTITNEELTAKNIEYIFQLLLNKFQININNIFLINVDKNSLNQQFNSTHLQNFYFYYKNIFDKVYNYTLFLLNKYNINDLLKIYKNIKSLSLNNEIINHIYVEVLHEKKEINSDEKANILTLLYLICNEQK
ncbi:conserved protein, unknown function [Hepatocystis sp. ex Piliocolobus tephrosceles]|nr:conserved protein, unknown function [Hepatocystis sp. ex Piliocolobus tephrosceles]